MGKTTLNDVADGDRALCARVECTPSHLRDDRLKSMSNKLAHNKLANGNSYRALTRHSVLSLDTLLQLNTDLIVIKVSKVRLVES